MAFSMFYLLTFIFVWRWLGLPSSLRGRLTAGRLMLDRPSALPLSPGLHLLALVCLECQ